MKPTKLVALTLIPFTLALLPGCALKKKSADASAPTSAAAASAPVAAAPAPTETPAAEPAKAPAPVKAPKPPVLQDVTILSNPSGARVLLDGNEVGVTPLMAKLDVAAQYDLTLLLPNYLASTTTVKKSVPITGGVSLGKTGLASHGAPSLPGVVRVSLSVDKDPVKALTSAIKALDGQLKSGQITPAIYKAKLVEVTRFYTGSK